MTDPFPALTNFLDSVLLYLIYIGIILSAISGVLAGIFFLPVLGFNEQRTAIGSKALRMTIVGIVIILLAVPARTAILHFLPPPAGVPSLPSFPTAVPSTPTP